MKVLLDECLPKRLKQSFQQYEVYTVPEMGWAGKTNGELLKLAKGKFEIFITVDQNLQYQQNLEGPGIAIILLVVKDNRYETFKPLIPKIQQAIQSLKPSQLVKINST